MSAVLPSGLQAKLCELAAHDRRQRLVRGSIRVAAVALAGAGAVMALDAWLSVPPLARVPLVLAWAAAVGLAIRRLLIAPLRTPVAPSVLAAAVEAEYPRLDERLTSSVELAERTGEGFGSPVLIELLLRDTESRSRTIDFDRAATAPRSRGALVALAAVGVLAGMAVLIWPDAVAGLSRRFVMPWDRSPAVVPFDIVVTSDGDVVGKGRSWSVRAQLVPRHVQNTLPDYCTLIVTPAGASPLRLRMNPRADRGAHDFHIDRVTGDFRYSLEAGPLRSEEFGVDAVTAPELTAAQIMIVPPAYAQKAVEARRLDTLGDFSALQFSRAKWICRFDRPAVGAWLIWRGSAADGTGETETRMPMALADNGASAAIDYLASGSGRYCLVWEGERGVISQSPSFSVKTMSDRPPEFRRVAGLRETLHEMSATEVLTLQLSLADDIGLSSAAIEFRVNNGGVENQPLALTGLGTREANGSTLFPLAEKVHVGDRIACRLKIADNRSIPETGLEPQVNYFPANDQWCEWEIVESALPAREREAAAQRDAVDRAIRDLVGQLDKSREEMAALARQDKGQPKPTDADQTKLEALQKANQESRQGLEALARQAEMQGLAPITDAARSIASREMQQAAEFLNDAAAADRDRAAALRQAEKTTGQARERLERLRAENQQLAQQRLDAGQMERLADKQNQLAEQTSTASDRDQKEKLKKEQQGLTNDLDRLTQQNEGAKEALRAANAEEARRLSDQARALAKAERDLDQAIREAERTQNAGKLIDAAKKQAELADQIDRLAKKMKRAFAAAQTAAPSGAEAAFTADTLRRSEADEARNQQQRSADALDQLADRLQTALNAASDPREAARQLGRLQEETRRRTLDNSRPGMPERDALLEDERALLQAIDQLPIGEEQTGARREQIDSAGKARQAITALQNGHANTAADLMQQAQESLDRIGESLPSPESRQRAARAALDKTRKAQAQLNNQAQSAIRGNRRPSSEEAAALAKQQAELAEQIAKLDAPRSIDRRDAARTAAGDALDDLMAGRWGDVSASQAALKRTLQRFDEALRGKIPVDAQVRELAHRQRDLAEEGKRAAGDAGKVSALKPWQEQIVRQIQELDSTEAATRQVEAAVAANRANQALRDQPDDASTVDALQRAAQRLEEWSDQLAGKETVAERAARLARNQAELAQSPQPDDPTVRRQQSQIADEMRDFRPGEKAAAEKKHALDALDRLPQLAANSAEHRSASRDAADALQRLAERLKESPDAAPPPSPAELAQQQRDLAVATGTIPKQNGQARVDALDQAVQQQRTLREQTNRLPSGTTPRAVQQSRLSMAQAEQALARQDVDQGRHLQLKAAAALEDAARDTARRQTPKNPAPTAGAPTAEQIQEVRELARRQRELEKQVKSSTAGTQPPLDADRRQNDIAEQTEELAARLQQDISPPAANAARQARDAMGAAQQQQSTDPAEARNSRQRAAEALDRAAEEAQRKLDSEMRAGSPNPPPPGQTGRALLKARGKMQSAQQQLEKDDTKSAGKEMRGAAQSLKQAAQDMQNAGDSRTQAGNSPPDGANPNAGGQDGKRLPVSEEVANELERHAGKKWGELPGELRTRILQDVKAQYGDDYARIIRLYFESLADRK
jgi:hypothetical protein